MGSLACVWLGFPLALPLCVWLVSPLAFPHFPFTLRLARIAAAAVGAGRRRRSAARAAELLEIESDEKMSPAQRASYRVLQAKGSWRPGCHGPGDCGA
eukprot:gene10510-601_t